MVIEGWNATRYSTQCRGVGALSLKNVPLVNTQSTRRVASQRKKVEIFVVFQEFYRVIPSHAQTMLKVRTQPII